MSHIKLQSRIKGGYNNVLKERMIAEGACNLSTSEEPMDAQSVGIISQSSDSKLAITTHIKLSCGCTD
jgi:hypothetical protein